MTEWEGSPMQTTQSNNRRSHFMMSPEIKRPYNPEVGDEVFYKKNSPDQERGTVVKIGEGLLDIVLVDYGGKIEKTSINFLTIINIKKGPRIKLKL